MTLSASQVLYGFDFLKHSLLLVLSVVGLAIGLLSTWKAFGSRSASVQRIACLLASLCFAAGVCEALWSAAPDASLFTGFKMAYGSASLMPIYCVGFLGTLLGGLLALLGTFLVRPDGPAERDEPIETRPQDSIFGLRGESRVIKLDSTIAGGSSVPGALPERAKAKPATPYFKESIPAEGIEPPKGERRYVGIGLGLLAAVVLVVMLLPGGSKVGPSRLPASTDSKSPVVAFFVDYNAGNFEKLYQSTLAEFRKSTSLEDFLEDMRVRETYLGPCELSDVKWRDKETYSGSSTTSFFAHELVFAKGKADANLLFMKQDGVWKLSMLRLDVPEDLVPDHRAGLFSVSEQITRILGQTSTEGLKKVYDEASPKLRKSLSFTDFQKQIDGYREELGECTAIGFHMSNGVSGSNLECTKKRVSSQYRFDDHAGVLELVSLQIPAPPEHDLQTLLQMVKAADSGVRRQAAKELGELRPKTKDAVLALAELLKDAEPSVAKAAAQTLGDIGAEAAAAVPALAEAVNSQNKGVHHEAGQALYAIGPAAKEALPILLARVQKTGPEDIFTLSIIAQIDPAAATPTLLKSIKSPDAKVRANAADLLGDAKPASESVVSALGAALQDSEREVRKQAAGSLLRIGAPAVPVLLKALQGKNKEATAWAAAALAKMGPDAKEAVPYFVQALTAAARKEAAEARRTGTTYGGTPPSVGEAEKPLVGIGAAAVPALLKLLRGPDADLREAAGEALGKIGLPAASGLVETLKSRDPQVRMATAEAFHEFMDQKLGPEDQQALQPAVQALAQMLKASDPKLRSAAARGLRGLSSAAKAAVPALIEALSDHDESVFHMVNYALQQIAASGAMGSEGTAAVPVLTQVLGSDTWEDRRLKGAAAGTLAALWQAGVGTGPEADAAVPLLIEIVSDRESGWHQTDLGPAADALGALGAKAEPAVLTLIEALDEFPGRENAAKALGNIGPAAREAVPALRKLVDSSDDPLAHQAKEALKKIGPEALSTAIPALIRKLRGDYQVKHDAATHLARLWHAGLEPGPDADAAVSVLIGMLQDDLKAHDLGAAAAAKALGALGPRAAAAVPALIADLDFVPEPAAIALGEIGPPAREAVPALRQIVDRNLSARLTELAQWALKQISP
jgi:HEAT repeat protein